MVWYHQASNDVKAGSGVYAYSNYAYGRYGYGYGYQYGYSSYESEYFQDDSKNSG